MSISSESEILKLASSHLSVVDVSGRTVLAVGLTATLYLEEGCSAATRAAVASCCMTYAMRHQRDLRWALNPD